MAAFALAMEAKLQRRDHYRWWGDIPLFALVSRLKSEFWELHEAVALKFGNRDISGEAVDVAICSMFVFDNAERGADEEAETV